MDTCIKLNILITIALNIKKIKMEINPLKKTKEQKLIAR